MASDIINSKIPNPNGDGVPVTLKANTSEDGTGDPYFLKCDTDGKLLISGGAGGEEVSIVNPKGSKTSAESVSVVIASDQGALQLQLPIGAATDATLSDGSQVAQIKANTIKDGTGTSYSPLVNDDGRLQVDIVSGGGGGTQHTAGSGIGATPIGTLAIGKDSGNVARAVATDTDGHLQVDILTSTLPSGAATEATLSTVDGKITACNTGAVVVSSSALPFGAATAALQVLSQTTTSIFSGSQTITTGNSQTFTNTLDKNGSTKFNLLISSSTNPANIEYNVEVEVSDDGSTYYSDANGGGMVGPTSVSQIQNAQISVIDQTSRYARFSILNNSLGDLTITSIKATTVKGI